jgi:cytochrome P450
MSAVPEIRFFERDILSSPFKFYATAFARHPMIKVAGQDVYCVFSDHLVREVIRRVEDFSSDFGSFTMGARAEDPQIKAITGQGWPFVKTLVIADPPVHTRFRKLVNAAFSKRRIDGLERSIRSIAERLLDRAPEGEAFDFVRDFAVPLPVEVISDLLGLRELDIDTVKRWSDAILERFGGRGLIDRERELQCAREILAFQRAMMAFIAKRRAGRESDLISDLASAKLEDERPLDDVEILSVLQQVMAAGNETTTIALTRGLLLLIAHPDQQQRARKDFGRIPAMVEEILRIESPAQSVWRITRGATTLGGVRLPAGTMVMARVGAANRDPEAFTDPERFDIDRKDVSNHIAFGRGIHTCLGNLLARKELVVGFQTIFSKLDNIRVAAGASTEFLPDLVHPSLPSLPIEFTRLRP